jgi:nitrous oxidase accessory protein NosD
LFSEINITRPVQIDGLGHSLSQGLLINANNVLIENTKITPSEFTPSWYFGIMVGDVTGVVLRNNTITGNGNDEVGISDTTGSTGAQITVQGNTLSNLWTGILIDSANTDASITSNSISDTKHGIYVSQASFLNSISSNNISNPKAITSPAGPGDGISLPNGTSVFNITLICFIYC